MQKKIPEFAQQARLLEHPPAWRGELVFDELLHAVLAVGVVAVEVDRVTQVRAHQLVRLDEALAPEDGRVPLCGARDHHRRTAARLLEIVDVVETLDFARTATEKEP